MVVILSRVFDNYSHYLFNMHFSLLPGKSLSIDLLRLLTFAILLL